ncbi:MAG: GPR endopeptidase [Bacillota bacterium]
MKQNDHQPLFTSDLILELEDVLNVSSLDEADTGISVKETEHSGITVSDVVISDRGEERTGKKAGRYISFHLPRLLNDSQPVIDTIAKVIQRLVVMPQLYPKILVVGLGNQQVTPDALGPLVVGHLNITAHLPEQSLPTVSAFVPGVMGVTGMETEKLIKGVVEETKPSLVILIDAPKARHIERLNRTIQLTDTGIQPGSGVGQHRTSINHDYLGVPVVSIGIPTVVDAVTITYDAMMLLSQYFNQAQQAVDAPRQRLFSGSLHVGDVSDQEALPKQQAKKYFGLFGALTHEDQRQLITEVLTEEGRNLIVTQKSIDEDIDYLNRLLAEGITEYITRTKSQF